MINRKIGRLAQLFMILFALTAALLFYWQVVDANYLVNRPENQRLRLAQHAIHRGTIYDRRGAALARTTFGADGTSTRAYPYPSLGALLGYHSWRYGNAGLEAAYNDFLNGQAVLQPVDNPIRRLLGEPVVGDDLHLTIDARIQQIVTDAMGRGPGACIVADPRTGAILALESQPWFDPNRVDDSDYWTAMRARTDSPFLDRALQGLYPPGSTFKALTLAAAYDSRKYSPSTVLTGQDATGPLYVDGYLLRSDINNLPPGVSAVTTVDAFKYSDNIAFATIGMNLGPRIFLDYAQRFGFGRSIPFQLPVKQSSVTAHPASFSQLDLAESAFGQGGVLSTPLQMLLVDEAIAHGGAEPQPYVVAGVTAPNREISQQTAPGVWAHPISARTAAKMRAAMTAVVEAPGGSGFLARVPGVVVAGKTGTAQAPSGPAHAWFIGFAPADHPRLAVVVFKEHGGEGFSQAAPIAGSIIRQALPLVR
jgi:peptidoglycan glycosyltransferase